LLEIILVADNTSVFTRLVTSMMMT